MFFANNIVGKGFLAQNLNKIKKDILNSGYIIYAAGISNSKTNAKKELNREFDSIKSFSRKIKNEKFIYISTADILDNLKKKNKYVANKVKIEKFVKNNFKHFIIIRLPQIIGKSKNKKTLVNFFYTNIKNKKKFILFKNIKRNILDIKDVLIMIKIILKNKIKNKIIVLSNKYFVRPLEIVNIFEKKLNKKAVFTVKNSPKQVWRLNYKRNLRYTKPLNLRFDRNYLLKAINKYY